MKILVEKITAFFKGNAEVHSLSFIYLLLIFITFQHAWVPGMFMDGATYAAIGKNAMEMGRWLVPYYNAEAYPRFAEHPPFYFMYLGGIFKIFGVSWTTARLAVLFLNLITVTTLWYTLKGLINRRYAFLTLLILCLSYPFIRKCRYPLLETPLLLFSTLCFLSYYKAFLWNKGKDYFLAGLFWGCALLMKGHAAFFIPAGIGLHLLLTQNFKKFLSFRLWAALFLGFAIFALWPLALHLSGNIDIFHSWFTRQFTGTVVESRGKTQLDFFLYFKIIATQTLPWFALSLWGSFKLFKTEKREHIGFLFIAWFWALLLPYSLLKWKYSHYIHPAYVPMAALAAYAFLTFKESVSLYFSKTIKILAIIAVLVYACLPIGIKAERDKELLEAVELTKYLKTEPNAWGDIEEAYEFWSFLPPLKFSTHAEVYRLTLADVENFLQGQTLRSKEEAWSFYITEENAKKLEQKYPEVFKEKLSVLVKISKFNTLVLVEKKLLSEEAQFGVISHAKK